ncbi:MAG: LysE family translocator [Psychrobium sp.]|nr:LysE family translocator [Psychrobium sp.]
MESLFLSQFLVLAAAHFFAIASPGPDFAVIIKQSIKFGRRNAIFTSIGIGSAILVHVAYSALGVGILIKQSPMLFDILKYLCAAYLAYIGFKALRSQPAAVMGEDVDTIKSEQHQAITSSFRLGFITNVLNPKATLFFLSIFSVVVSQQTPNVWLAIYALYLSLATALWFCMVSVVFSKDVVRNKFLAMGHYFDRAMGFVLILLAIKVAFSQI